MRIGFPYPGYKQIVPVAVPAEVLVVVRGTLAEGAQIKQRDDLLFPVLTDEDGQVH
jgi:hypothetical protein